MDEIVKQAMAKWPNIPHCYGWLARDARAQALKLPGDKITNPALLAFINRNYMHDDKGRWYFQNGPQRVYVNLEATPYIARTDPVHGFVAHTGEPLSTIKAAWLTDDGLLLFQSGQIVALLDDRDTAQCLPHLRIGNAIADDEQLLAWMNGSLQEAEPSLEHAGRRLKLDRIARSELAVRFGFDASPQPD